MELTCKHTEGVVPFSGNSFSFTSLMATITLFSAFVGEWIIGFEYYCRLCALPLVYLLLLAEIELPGFVLSRPSASPSRTPLKRKSQVRKVFEALILTKAFHPFPLPLIFLVAISQLGLREPVAPHRLVLQRPVVLPRPE